MPLGILRGSSFIAIKQSVSSNSEQLIHLVKEVRLDTYTGVPAPLDIKF